MARLPRLVIPGQAHYLILCAHDSLATQGICTDASDRDDLLAALREAAGTEDVRVHAYAILPGELQLLATPVTGLGLGRFVQALGRRYVSAYNRKRQRSGTLWDGRFRCAVVEPGPQRLSVMRLIDSQTPDAGMSSAGHHCGSAREALLQDLPEIWTLGNTPFEREAAYRELLASGLSAEQSRALRKATLGGWAIGSPAFLASLAALSPSGPVRPAAPRPRGRPRLKAE